MKTRARRSVFLLAAEKQFYAMRLAPQTAEACSDYACDNIGYAVGKIDMGKEEYVKESPEKDFFREKFKPELRPDILNGFFAWWPLLPDGGWDHESRILALLLCAEMLRR